MKKNLYFATLIISTLAFSAENAHAPYARDPVKARINREKYQARTRFFESLRPELAALGLLSPDTVVPRISDSHKIFSLDQRTTMVQTFHQYQDEAAKDSIVRRLKERHAPLVEQLLLADPNFSPDTYISTVPRKQRKRDLERVRPYDEKYRTKIRFFRDLVLELTAQGILAQHEIVIKKKPHSIPTFSRDQQKTALNAFAKHPDNATKDNIARTLKERYPALVEQLLMQANQAQSHVSNSRPPATLESLYAPLNAPEASL